MAGDNFLDLILIVLILLFCPLSHVLKILLFVERYLLSATKSIHALQNLAVTHTRFEKGRIEWKVNALPDAFMLLKRIDPFFLQTDQTAVVALCRN